MLLPSSYFHGEGNGNPLQCSCLENPRDGGAWWAAVYGVAQSRTRLKRLSSSSYFQFHSTAQIITGAFILPSLMSSFNFLFPKLLNLLLNIINPHIRYFFRLPSWLQCTRERIGLPMQQTQVHKIFFLM